MSTSMKWVLAVIGSFIVLVVALAVAGALLGEPEVRTVTEPGPTVTRTVEIDVPGPEVTVQVEADNSACLAALDAADTMSLSAADKFTSLGTILGDYVPVALEAAAAWDVETLESVTELIQAENAVLDADGFEALVDDYVAKATACRAGS